MILNIAILSVRLSVSLSRICTDLSSDFGFTPCDSFELFYFVTNFYAAV